MKFYRSLALKFLMGAVVALSFTATAMAQVPTDKPPTNGDPGPREGNTVATPQYTGTNTTAQTPLCLQMNATVESSIQMAVQSPGAFATGNELKHYATVTATGTMLQGTFDKYGTMTVTDANEGLVSYYRVPFSVAVMSSGQNAGFVAIQAKEDVEATPNRSYMLSKASGDSVFSGRDIEAGKLTQDFPKTIATVAANSFACGSTFSDANCSDVNQALDFYAYVKVLASDLAGSTIVSEGCITATAMDN
ncbi:MAG: hypothetical protein U1F57_11375 [bacterium]